MIWLGSKSNKWFLLTVDEERRRLETPFFFQYGQVYIFFCSCLKGWLQALGVGSRSLMVFQWVFVRSDCAPPGGLRSSPRVIYYLSPPPAALWLRGRCQQRRGGGDDYKGVRYGRQGRGHTERVWGKRRLKKYNIISMLTGYFVNQGGNKTADETALLLNNWCHLGH